MSSPKLKTWILASRPKTLWAGAAPVLIGSAIAFSGDEFHALSAVSALLGAVLIQIGTNFANDYSDFVKGADTEERIGPVRATQSGLVTPGQMKWATILVFASVFLPGAYIIFRGGWPFVIIGVLSIICGVLYTAGPMPLGYVGLGDVFVFIFFGPVAVGGTYYLQTLQPLSAEVILSGVATGLLAVALLTINNLRDIDQDRKANKRTLAVRFGRTFARAEFALCLIVSALVIPLYLYGSTGRQLFAAVPLIVLFVGMPALRTVLTQTDGPALNHALATTGKVLFVFSVIFSLSWML